ALERAGSPEAVKLVRSLAGGAAEARLTRGAEGGLERQRRGGLGGAGWGGGRGNEGPGGRRGGLSLRVRSPPKVLGSLVGPERQRPELQAASIDGQDPSRRPFVADDDLPARADLDQDVLSRRARVAQRPNALPAREFQTHGLKDDGGRPVLPPHHLGLGA